MANKVLVAGASGRLGTHVLKELGGRGYRTRALIRDLASFNGNVPRTGEIVVRDARRPESLAGVADGVDVIISAMGASLSFARTPDRATYRDVDFRANLNLLEQARASGVRKFVYVSLHGAERMRGLAYVDAHEDFVEALRASGLDYTIVRPTGFFYVFDEIFRMAERGRAVLCGDGGARTNPVHEEDVARECADAVECGGCEVSVGGPETYTRREIAEMAFSILNRRPKITSAPAWAMRAAAKPLRLFDRRLADFVEFGVAVSTADVVAPAVGKYSLRRHFRHLAGLNSGVHQLLTSSPDVLARKAQHT